MSPEGAGVALEAENQDYLKYLPRLFDFLVLGGILVFIGIIYLAVFGFPRRGFNYVDYSKYQAVFLANGQVYFGKLENPESDYPRLTGVYYLQTGGFASSTSDVRLVKLGSELHQPEDAMYLQKSQILFYENLKDESRVVQAINNYQGQR